MIELKKGYDSASACTCDWCKGTITPLQDKIVYGTGNSFAVVLHPKCEPEFQEFYCFVALPKTNLSSHELRS